jgi:phospholipase C
MVNGAKQAISTDLLSKEHVQPRRKNLLGRRSLSPPSELMWVGGGACDAKSTFALLNSIIVLYTDTMRSFDHCFGDFPFTQDLERRHSESAGEKSILEYINR